MRTLTVTEFITLDGVIEDPGGSEGMEGGGWAFAYERGAEGDKFKLDETLAAEILLLGRTTYEGFAAAWPSRTDDVGFADKFNSMPKVVVSSTIDSPSWNNSTVVSGDVAKEVAVLKEQGDGDILVAGSGELVRELLRHDLVDELRLMVFPLVLGKGKKLFEDGLPPKHLRIADVKTAGEVVILTLRRKEA